MQPPFFCDYGSNIVLGERVFFNFNCVVLDVCMVKIGDFTFAGGESDVGRRQDIYRCIVACLTTGPDAIWRVLRPQVLSRTEAEQLINRFFGKAA